MNGKGGCCIARYGRGGGGGVYGMSKVDRIMLKFRPIAPKPVAAGSGSGGLAMENSDGYVKCRRGKRKYVRVNRNKNKKDNFKSTGEKNNVTASSSSGGDAVVTLSLLPETPDRKANLPVTGVADPCSGKCNCNNNDKRSAPAPVWLSFDKQEQKVCYGDMDALDPVVVKPPPPPPGRQQVVSYVTMECVTDTSVDAEGLGCTDEERVMNMEMDTCPGFISDGLDRVVWTNKAYRQMAGDGYLIGGEDIAVVLVRKDRWTPSPATCPAFTCKARVISAAPSHRETLSSSSPAITLPCDVWRMDCGGYAWRLDVKAALSLGR